MSLWSAGGWVKCDQRLHLRQMLLMHYHGMELLPSFWITKSVISFKTIVTYVKIFSPFQGILKKLKWYSFFSVQPRAWITKERLIKDIQWIKGKSWKLPQKSWFLGSNASYVLSYISDTTIFKVLRIIFVFCVLGLRDVGSTVIFFSITAGN